MRLGKLQNVSRFKNYLKPIGKLDVTKYVKLPTIETKNKVELDSKGNKNMLLSVGGGLAGLLILWSFLFKKKTKKRRY